MWGTSLGQETSKTSKCRGHMSMRWKQYHKGRHTTARAKCLFALGRYFIFWYGMVAPRYRLCPASLNDAAREIQSEGTEAHGWRSESMVGDQSSSVGYGCLLFVCLRWQCEAGACVGYCPACSVGYSWRIGKRRTFTWRKGRCCRIGGAECI